MTTHDVLACWRFDPLALVIGAAIVAVHVRRGSTGLRTVSVGLALAVLAVALASPVAALANGYLFSAHMLQHLLLVLVVPPLVLLGERRRVRATDGSRAALGWVLGVGAMWVWHERTLCNAAATASWVHAVQEVSLLAMGLAFWWPILSPRARIAPLAAVVYLFTACLACTLLGIIVTFSPVEVCSVFAHPVDRLGVMPLVRDGWGLDAATDQQLGGLLMWVPACLIYGAGILGALVRLYRDDGGGS
jgi:putative membrane protein